MDITHLTGAITALVTPFDKKGDVDFAALERFVDFQIDGGIDGLLVLGTTGESATMTDAEDVEVVRTVVERVAGRVPVIGGAGSNATAESMRKSKMLQEAGVDGLLLITPYYNKSNEEGIYRHFSYVLDRVDVPCLLYNVPSRTGCALSEANVARLSKHANAWGIKEASGDIAYATKIARYVGDDFTLWSGNDDMITPLLSLGASGVISVWSNIAPQTVRNLVAYWHDGNPQKAREIQLANLDLIHALFCEVNPIPVKYALAEMGLLGENYRLPLWKLTDAHKALLAAELKKAGILHA